MQASCQHGPKCRLKLKASRTVPVPCQPVPSLCHAMQASYQRALKSRPELKACRFLAVDRNDPAALRAVMKGVDLVLHTAGPFQRKSDCYVLEAALETGTAYVDICDDSDYAARAKEYHEQAKAAGVPAITSAGACS